jgi:hypothetical protein
MLKCIDCINSIGGTDSAACIERRDCSDCSGYAGDIEKPDFAGFSSETRAFARRQQDPEIHSVHCERELAA